MMPIATALAWCLLALLASGCGGRAVGAISGTVKFQDQPLPEGIISFVTEKGEVVTGKIQDGTYEVKAVPVGPARITVRQIIDPLAQNPKPSRVREISVRYQSADDSGLTYTVVRGSQVHDFELNR
jgi:hypothetical protein